MESKLSLLKTRQADPRITTQLPMFSKVLALTGHINVDFLPLKVSPLHHSATLPTFVSTSYPEAYHQNMASTTDSVRSADIEFLSEALNYAINPLTVRPISCLLALPFLFRSRLSLYSHLSDQCRVVRRSQRRKAQHHR